MAGAPGGEAAQPEATADDRRRRIAEAAYYRAERRGFAAGYEDADWLDAEKEIEGQEEERRKPDPARARRRERADEPSA